MSAPAASAFATSLLGPLDCHLLAEGRHWRAYEVLGAHARCVGGVAGVAFAVWAPTAQRVSVVGDFNGWSSRDHPMRARHECGVWELFVPGLAAGARYQFELRTAEGDVLRKSDPFAFRVERAPGTASIVVAPSTFEWTDAAWLARRPAAQSHDAPLSIYEAHLDSWRRGADDAAFVEYVAAQGFTHVELMPVSESPFGGSWGYQSTALYAPGTRWRDPDGLRALVDRFHAASVGVILDWVPAHFPSDPHALARFDGSCLYEHADPRRGRHPDWDTLIYNYGRYEVANYLIANALYWLREFHADGLRVDAVASMLYLDYSRAPGDWLPNADGGNENREAIEFLRTLNDVVRREGPPGVLTIAEESTAWPRVTHATAAGGLGFDYKWDMGWMHDALRYFQLDPIHRRFHHDALTFAQLYASSERYVLPLSHDEVVHGKGSLLAKMPGDRWQRFANLRLCLSHLWLQPGKKLLFMGGEIAQRAEWDHDGALDWDALDEPNHAGVQRLVRDLNRIYRAHACLHAGDCDRRGFRWIDCDDARQSVLTWLRHDPRDGSLALVAMNFTPVVRHGYRIGVPREGRYREILNSDAVDYGGSGVGNLGAACSEGVPSHGHAQSLALTLPPLAALVLVPDGDAP